MGLSWTDEALEQRMREGWTGGLADGTPCGGGSTIEAASNVWVGLPFMLTYHGIATVCDAGAGDLHWARKVRWPKGVTVRWFDIVKRHPRVEVLDVSAKRLPFCDLVLCRHVLIHFDPPRIERTLKLFRQRARYLLASQYDDAPPFDDSLQYNPTNLRPLLGEPIAQIPDTGSILALWKL